MKARSEVRILVTNDDGIDAPGLHALASALHRAGYDVIVAAPRDDCSGSGAAIGNLTAGGQIHVEPRTIEGIETVPAFGVDGPPALAVLAARLGGFGEPPELVVAGVNPGNNTGRSTLHSGTVGAALTAANFGVSGLAVSIGWAEHPHWDTACRFAVAAVDWLGTAPVRTVLNLNLPDLDFAEVRGVRWAELAPFGTVRAAVVSGQGGPLQMELHETGLALPPNTDTALVIAGYAAITAIVGIRSDEWLPVAAEVERRASASAGPRTNLRSIQDAESA